MSELFAPSMTTTAPFSSAMASVDDMMEVSTDVNRELQPDDDIDIDLDIEGDAFGVNEDENMGDGDGNASYKDDDEMADDDVVHEDEVIEDAVEYDHKEEDIFFIHDEELQDAEEVVPQQDLHLQMESSLNNTDTAVVEPDGVTTKPKLEPTVNEVAFVSEDGSDQVDQSLQAESTVTQEPTSHEGEGDLEASQSATEATGLSNVADAGPVEPLSAGQEADSKAPSQEETGVASNSLILPEHGDTDHDGSAHFDLIDDLPSEAAIAHESHEGSASQPEQEVIAEIGKDSGEVPNLSVTNPTQDETAVIDSHSDLQANLAADEETDTVYQATVNCQDSEMSLFPPSHGDGKAQTYLLADESLAKGTLKALLDSCRNVLGESVIDSEELELNIPSLGLTYSDSTEASSDVSLAQLIDIYSQLQHNDGTEDPEPLYLVLEPKQRMPVRLQALYDAISQGQGLSQVSAHLGDSGSDSQYLEEQPESYEDADGNQLPAEDLEGNADERSEVANSAQDTYDDLRPGTPKATLLSAENVEVDNIDFNSPHRTNELSHYADSKGGDSGQAQTSPTVTAHQILATDLDDDIEPDPLRDEDTFTQKQNVEERNSTEHNAQEADDIPDSISEEELEEPTLNTNTHSSEDSLEGDANLDTTTEQPLDVDETETIYPPLPPDFDDDLDNFDDSLEPQAVESGAPSSATATNDATSTPTLQGDQPEDGFKIEVLEDEITYDDDDIENSTSTAVDRDLNATNGSSSPGSLKRQRTAGGGDEDDEFDSSLQPQHDTKRVRSNEESK